ncbi:hypothetical protein F5Y01DRAFT_151318 [Xylaria sp. FL0043]|nr:hypothetical protein F5Y01DRAFT_151318 [Xylaria sp. FL0043]
MLPIQVPVVLVFLLRSVAHPGKSIIVVTVRTGHVPNKKKSLRVGKVKKVDLAYSIVLAQTEASKKGDAMPRQKYNFCFGRLINRNRKKRH